MQNKIFDDGCPILPDSVARLLPSVIADEIAARLPDGQAPQEITLRAGKRAFLTCGKSNLPLDAVISDKTLTEIFLSVCGGSLYAHADTVNHGFVTLADGVRVGISGRAVTQGDRITAITDVSSLCFRIPRNFWIDPAIPISALRSFSLSRGILLFSPPGGGKTTALRSIVRALASGETPLRVAVVDTRYELSPFLTSKELCVDLLSGYPRREGIEIAARSLGAQVIVCDEICGCEEAEAVIEIQSGGAAFIATAHASDLEGLLSRTDMALLHQAGTFGAYLRVDRHKETPYTVYPRESDVL